MDWITQEIAIGNCDDARRFDKLREAGLAAPLAKVRGRYRWQILLKSRRRDTLHGLLREFHNGWQSPAGIRTVIDVDPVQLV